MQWIRHVWCERNRFDGSLEVPRFRGSRQGSEVIWSTEKLDKNVALFEDDLARRRIASCSSLVWA